MNDDRNQNAKNNTPHPRPNGQRQAPTQRPAARPAHPQKRPQNSATGEFRRPNVNLTGSLNTGNFRVQNTGSFTTQNTGSFRAQNTGSFKQQNTGNFRTQGAGTTVGTRRPVIDDTQTRPQARHPEPRPEPRMSQDRRRTPHRTSDDYLLWFLILSVILLVALIATFLIIKFTNPADSSGAQLPDGNGNTENNNDNNNNSTTVPQWAVVPSNLKAFVPKTTSKTATISASGLNSAAAIMVDLKTGEVVGEYNPDTIIYPASLTKIMTAIVACELIKDMDDTFTLTNEIINPFVQQGASRANFCTGYAITMEELVYGVVLPSGADACAALAIKLCGSEAAFVEKMNEKAAAIGCTKTRFVNATGLHDDGHYSTVRDLATIMSYAMNNPFIREVLSTKTYTTTAPLGNPETGFYYKMNCIWASRYAGYESAAAEIFAAKTGYTPEAGQCLASVSRTNSGTNYVIVTVGARPSYTGENTKPMPYKDAKYILDTYLG